VGISSSALRSWEALGLVAPQRTKSRYRLYTEADVRLLQRALFLRRARGLNPPAIVHVLSVKAPLLCPPKLRHSRANAFAVCVCAAACPSRK
jgi:DNA-binding transcriptional MerR regulator